MRAQLLCLTGQVPWRRQGSSAADAAHRQRQQDYGGWSQRLRGRRPQALRLTACSLDKPTQHWDRDGVHPRSSPSGQHTRGSTDTVRAACHALSLPARLHGQINGTTVPGITDPAPGIGGFRALCTSREPTFPNSATRCSLPPAPLSRAHLVAMPQRYRLGVPCCCCTADLTHG